MSLTIAPAAIRKTLKLRTPPERAFAVFTAGFDRWWPRGHSIHTSPMIAAVLEPGVGGRWFSRHENGTEMPWGDVLVWEPPGRLVLAWRIGHNWKYDPNLLTEVELRFSDGGDGTTDVLFEHRHLERFGDSPEAASAIGSMHEGWGEILDLFTAAANAEQAAGAGARP